VHWHDQPIQFSIAFCMSSFIVAISVYIVMARLKAVKAKRKLKPPK